MFNIIKIFDFMMYCYYVIYNFNAITVISTFILFTTKYLEESIDLYYLVFIIKTIMQILLSTTAHFLFLTNLKFILELNWLIMSMSKTFINAIILNWKHFIVII